MNFYDILAAKKWGGGIPTINFFDLLFAQSMSGGEQWQVYEGALPATFNTNGADMRQYQIWGNTGGVGDRTVNLFNAVIEQGSFRMMSGQEYDSETHVRSKFEDNPLTAGTYTIDASGVDDVVVYMYDIGKQYILSASITEWQSLPFTFTVSANVYVRFAFRYSDNSNITPANISNILLTPGTAPPETYVPYGYKVDMDVKSRNLFDSGNMNVFFGFYNSNNNTIKSTGKNAFIYVPIVAGKKYVIKNFKRYDPSIDIRWVSVSRVTHNQQCIRSDTFLQDAGLEIIAESGENFLMIFMCGDSDFSNYGSVQSALNANCENGEIYIDCMATPIYIGDAPLEKDEYVDYQEQKVYRMINGVLTPTDPPVPLPALPTVDSTTIVDYAGSGTAPEKVYFEYQGGKQP